MTSTPHLNKIRTRRDVLAARAVSILAAEFSFPEAFQVTVEQAIKAPWSEAGAAISIYAKNPCFRRFERVTLRAFMFYADKVWQLESDGTPEPGHALEPEPICHRGCLLD